MKKWLIDNGLSVSWAIIGLYILATFIDTMQPFLPVIACTFFLLYGIMSVIMFEFHKKNYRLLLQILIVAGAITFEVLDAFSDFNFLIDSLSLIFFGLLFVDSLTLKKLVNQN